MKTKRLLVSLCAATAVLGLAACSGEKNETKYDATVWVSEVKGVKELTQNQIEKFNKANPEFAINATVEGISEGDAATKMITDVESGADVFCFAQDQLARLVKAKALNKLGVQASKTVRESHDEPGVKAATVGDDVYCYPLTSDNGYFMYYDKRVVSEDHIGKLEDIIADCEKNKKMIAYEIETNTWYNAGFFFGVGCHSNWTADDNGNFTAVDDNFNSEEGLIALQGMQKVLKSSAFLNSSDASVFSKNPSAGVLVSGTWASKTVKEILGDNMGVCALPKYTVNGKDYQIGSFFGNKLMGVKPQTDANKGAALQKLALYLTGAECQLERYTNHGWGPSNLEAQNNETVKNDVLLGALREQGKYSVTQGQFDGGWWDLGKGYAAAAKKADLGDTKALQDALKAYQDGIDYIINMPADVRNAYYVIGAVNGTNWNEDFKLEAVEGKENTYEIKDVEIKAGGEFKIRKGKSWNKNWGANNTFNGGNIKVNEDGKYTITFVYVSDEQVTITVTKQA